MRIFMVTILLFFSETSHAGHVFEHNGVEWETVGCFKDSWNRTLRHFFHDLTKDGLVKEELKKTGFKPYFDACADEAKENDYISFGIQYARECWGDKDPNRDYAINGPADNCESSDVKDDFFQIGGSWSNYIYRAKPIDGGFTDWGNWTECSVKCGGGGVQTSTRSCTNPKPRFKGKNCEGSTSKTRPCGQQPCPVDGGWSEFSGWGECSKTCGGGTEQRTRTCTNPPPADGGEECKGASTETRLCGTKPCPVDGKWSAFSKWSKCTKTCGGGTQERTRTCTNPPPTDGGKDCVGVGKETRACGSGKCPAEWKPISGTVCAEGKGKRPAVFTPSLEGIATKLKLVYKSGYIRCANNNKHNSHWGCWDHSVLKRDGLNMVITDSQDSIILPAKFDFPKGKWYKIPGYNSKSPSLVFKSDVGMYICKRCPLKVWYGEDLVDHTTEDNSGKVCFQVFAFVLPEPEKPRCAVPKGKWAQLSPHPVCFEGKGKKPGEFSPLFKTSSTKLKLVHQSGLIRCADNKKHNSYWGCWDHSVVKQDGLDVVVTDKNNKILLPTKFDFPKGKWYKQNGFNSKSKSLVLTSEASLSFGEQLKLWYGEDLVDHTTSDNHGAVCAEVFVSGP